MKEVLDRLKYLLNKNKSIDYICSKLNLTNNELIYLSSLLDIDLNMKVDTFSLIEEPLIIDNNKEHLKLLLMGDTHLCNKCDRVDIIKEVYSKANDKNVDYILHSGDFVDGYPLISNYEKMLKENTYDGQIEYTIENYPIYKKTLVISGNHDETWYRRCSKDILEDISNKREDIIYIGPSIRDIYLGNINIKILHGNPSYYLGSRFKPIKYIQNLSEKPDIVHSGHLHIAHNDKIDNTYYFRSASLMDNTPYNISRNYDNEKSVYWVDLYLDDNGSLDKVKYKRELFY